MSKKRTVYMSVTLCLIMGFAALLYNKDRLVNAGAAAAVDVDYTVTKLSLNKNSIEILRDEADGFIDIALLKQGDKARTIAEDNSVYFEKIIPNRTTPEIVILSEHGGGNCCEPTPLLIDMKADEAFVSEPLSAMDSVSVTLKQTAPNIYEFSGLSAFPVNVLGDYVRLSAQYDRESKTLNYQPINGKQDLSALIGAYPASAFKNKPSRSVLLSGLSDREFGRIRKFFDVGSPTILSDYRYILGSGIKPHSGRDEEGRYVIDLITNNWLIVILYDGMAKMKCYISADSDALTTSLLLEMEAAYDLNSEDVGQCNR